jgi:hypothetical protein
MRGSRGLRTLTATNFNCHGPRLRAIQMIVKLHGLADARLLDGPVKPGHD